MAKLSLSPSTTKGSRGCPVVWAPATSPSARPAPAEKRKSKQYNIRSRGKMKRQKHQLMIVCCPFRTQPRDPRAAAIAGSEYRRAHRSPWRRFGQGKRSASLKPTDAQRRSRGHGCVAALVQHGTLGEHVPDLSHWRCHCSQDAQREHVSVAKHFGRVFALPPRASRDPVNNAQLAIKFL